MSNEKANQMKTTAEQEIEAGQFIRVSATDITRWSKLALVAATNGGEFDDEEVGHMVAEQAANKLARELLAARGATKGSN